jgi:hypothetical protein
MTEYIPGVCNIGPSEVSRRKKTGWAGLGISGVLLFVPSPYRLIIFFPITMAVLGFLQAHFHFCAGFGLRGIYNVLKPAGQTESVQQKEFRNKDRQKALQIAGMAIFIGLMITAIVN